jgi:hypothetical protein
MAPLSFTGPVKPSMGSGGAIFTYPLLAVTTTWHALRHWPLFFAVAALIGNPQRVHL